MAYILWISSVKDLTMQRNGAREMEERRCIRDTGKALKKYGSTSKHMSRTESLVKHVICDTDTLQGIALKYGVTVMVYSMFYSCMLHTSISLDYLSSRRTSLWH